MSNNPKTRDFRVREKLLTSGANSLSDMELLAILISSGSRQKSCVELAFDLLNHFGDLRTVINASPESFQQVHGLGIVRYVQLQAAKEICRRSDFIDLQKHVTLNNTQQTHSFLKRQLRDHKNETVSAIFLDNQHRVIVYETLFYGTINCATIHPRPIVERALHLNAAAIILAHNHPSGLSDPSRDDKDMTVHLQKALRLIDVQLLDHLIIGDNEVYSIMNRVKLVCH